MKSNKLFRGVQRVGRKAWRKVLKHAPEIMIGGGIVGTVGATVMACNATTKASLILDTAKQELDQIHLLEQHPDLVPAGEEYTESDVKNDLTLVYTNTAKSMVKIYWPSVLVGGLSIASILCGANLFKRRNVALGAAYTALDTAYRQYRQNVVEKYGVEEDRMLYHGVKDVKKIETIVCEDGTEVISEETIKAPATSDSASPYAKVFDDGCIGWTKDPEMNLHALRKMEQYANQKLQTQGYLFLNEVYDMIGIPRTKAGFVVGWLYDEKNPIGDNYVDFGLYNLENARTVDFVNGYERNILLDFNVDGDILRYM